MNTKDMVSLVGFALLVTLGLQYFTSRSPEDVHSEVVSGLKIAAPRVAQQTPELYNPLVTEIDFLDNEPVTKDIKSVIETPLMLAQFSTHGAIIQNLSFKRMQEGKEQQFKTISFDETTRENGAFLLALNGPTPYYYNLIEEREEDDSFFLVYEFTDQKRSITKEFRVYKEKYKIDLKIKVSGMPGSQARIVFPGPELTQITDASNGISIIPVESDELKAIVNNAKNGIDSEGRTAALLENLRSAPTLFGVEDRYYVHALVRDPERSVLRGYYALTGSYGIKAFLESRPFLQDKDDFVNLEFYVGPKETEAFAPVDSRLDATLNYGFWSPISKFLLSTMKFLHGYIPSYGIVIIVLTLLLKLMLLPFTFKQARAMKQTQELQRKLAYIEKKYKDNREVLMREKAELIRKHGMPGGMLGCLPLLLQIPLFFSLNRVLSSSFELYRVPFAWISDLSMPDTWYILPLFATVGMMLSMASVGDVRQRLPSMLMALIIGAVTTNLAAGLALFIVTSTWISVAENYLKKAFKI